MKIAVILPSLSNTGPAIVARDIVNGICDKVDLIDVYYFDKLESIEFNANTYHTNINDEIEFNNYDIIHSHMLRPDYYIWKNRSRINCKCVTTLHNYAKEDLKYEYNSVISFIFSRIWRLLHSRHDVIVTLSEHMQKYYSKYYDNNKLTYIQNGRDENLSSSTISDDETKCLDLIRSKYKIIGVLALLTKRKGIDQLIKYISGESNHVLLVIGNGKEELDLKEMAKNLGVEDRCIFLGFKSNAKDYFKYFDLYAMPSRSEGFCLALIEAASFKKPVICSDIPIFREMFNDSEVSFFGLDDLDSLKKAVDRTELNSDLYSQNIYNRYIKNYTAEIMSNKYLELYKKLLVST